jgi:hypothetical protein
MQTQRLARRAGTRAASRLPNQQVHRRVRANATTVVEERVALATHEGKDIKDAILMQGAGA